MVGKGLDPIFAQGSAPGRSAIAVVRLSGKLPASLYEELKIYKNERSFFLREINFGSFADSCLVLTFLLLALIREKACLKFIHTETN